MNLTVDKVKSLLGEPVVNVELSNQTIIDIMEMSEVMAKNLVKRYKCKDIYDYVLIQLVLINCKKTWMTNLHKYCGELPDNLTIGDFIYQSALDEEARLFSIYSINDLKHDIFCNVLEQMHNALRHVVHNGEVVHFGTM